MKSPDSDKMRKSPTCSVSAKSPNDDKVDKMRKPSYDEKVRKSTNTGTDNKWTTKI